MKSCENFEESWSLTGSTELRTDVDSANIEQCEQAKLCEHRTVRTSQIVRTVRTTNSANSSMCANSKPCGQFTLDEQGEQRTVRTVHIVRTVRTVHFLKIVEQGEQVRTLFGGAWSLKCVNNHFLIASKILNKWGFSLPIREFKICFPS